MIYIGITGLAGAGKSTFARKIVDEFFYAHIVPFAQPIKEFASLLGWDGKKNDKGRRLLQLLGTECGRECIDDNIWIDHWQRTVALIPKINCAIADDLRFNNEAKFLHANAGTIIKVKGRNDGVTDFQHPSEQGIDNYFCDYIVENDGDIEDLEVKAERIAQSIKGLLYG